MQRSPDESLHSWPLLVVDVETTGLIEDEHARVVELGAVLVHPSGAELAAFSSLVRPPRSAMLDADEAFEVHGIDPDLLEVAPRAHAVERAFLQWMDEWRPWVGGITSWRWSFDGAMLERLGRGSLAHLPRARCIHHAAHAWFGPMGHAHGPKLAEAAEALGVAVPRGRHRALVDAQLAAQVAVALERIATASGTRRVFHAPPAHTVDCRGAA